jgi:inhibitor of KinA
MNDKIYPLGENALTIEFGREISAELNEKVIKLAAAVEKHGFEGFIECVPAYASLTIFFDPLRVRKHLPDYPNAFAAVRNFVDNALERLAANARTAARTVEIPVSFAAEFAPDLGFVAELNGLRPAEVIEIFLSRTYRVFMLGFLPGFAYMGELDERIAAPRKENPRTRVAQGSVGFAGLQTGIYPLESPGGWQIVGRTEAQLFDKYANDPVLLKAGDLVRFIEK